MDNFQLRVCVEHLSEEGEEAYGEAPLEAVLGHEGHDGRVRCAFPMTYRLRISPVRGGILVRGRLSTILMAQCDRCLEFYRLPLDDISVCRFYDVPEDGVLDLTEDVREDMLLAFPDYFLCRQDCRGLCPSCGQNLNQGTCRCSAQSPGGESAGSEVWGALDRFSME